METFIIKGGTPLSGQIAVGGAKNVALKILIASLLIACLATTGLIFVTSPNIVWLASLLFMSRVGIAGVEVLRDSYFYKQVDADDTDLIAFFRTTRPVANIVATLGLLALFLFFPFGVFLYLCSGVLLVGFFLAFLL